MAIPISWATLLPGETLKQRNARLRALLDARQKPIAPITDIQKKGQTGINSLNKKSKAPVVPPVPTQTPAIQANTTPLTNVNLGYSADNINAPALQSTVWAVSQNQNQTAEQLAAAEMAWAQQIQTAMAGNQAAEATDIAAQQQVLDTLWIKDQADYATTVDMANKAAQESKAISARAGNAAASRMWDSGLTLSEWMKEDLQMDIASKSAKDNLAADAQKNSEIKNALTTLRSSGIDIFTKTATLKAIAKSMREKGIQPTLDAIKAGTLGKTWAIGKVSWVIDKIQQGLVDSQSGAAGALESNLSIENQYKNTPNDQRASLMTRLNKELAPYGDLLNSTIAAHPEWSKWQVETDLIQKIKWREDANAAYQIYLQSGKTDNEFWNKYGQTIATPGNAAYTAMNPTNAQQAATAAMLATQTAQTTNPLTLTSKENLEWFKSLGQSSPRQQQFVKDFKARTKGLSPEQLKVQRWPIFNALKKEFSNQA